MVVLWCWVCDWGFNLLEIDYVVCIWDCCWLWFSVIGEDVIECVYCMYWVLLEFLECVVVW